MVLLMISKRTSFSLTSAIFLFAYLLLGVSHIAMLPPWEGFDETAHYSYLQQIAETGILPRQKTARMSDEVEKYAIVAPVAYSSVPPMEHNGGFTYKSFFESPVKVIERGQDKIHSRPNEARGYSEGQGVNWESQHPPLYYFVLSPVYLATRNFSWGVRLFVLRLVSYLFALSGLLIAIRSCLGRIKTEPSVKANSRFYYFGIFAVSIWPILFPSWFPEMARLGNDSLCTLIMAVVWACVIRILNAEINLRDSLCLGISLGLGCLTKSFFLPVAVGVLSYLCILQFKLRGMRNFGLSLFHLALIVFLILILSGWWYVANWCQYGVILGSDEMIALNNAGGIVKGLKEGFSIKAFLRGHAAFVTTFAWSGTWSLARPPYVFMAPMAFIVILSAIIYVAAIRHSKITSAFWLPAWCTVPVLIGFSFHVLVRIALTGEGRGTSGYYLHFMVAPLAVALGIGLNSVWSNKSARIATLVGILYALTFSVAISWAQVLLFSGIIFKAGNNKFYQLPETMPPLFGLPEAVARLKVIAFPRIGVATWLSGGIIVLIGLIITWRNTNRLLLGNSVEDRTSFHKQG
jgi:hypothetical protein